MKDNEECRKGRSQWMTSLELGSKRMINFYLEYSREHLISASSLWNWVDRFICI